MAFEQWCMVELFGHSRIVGLVREEEIAGKGFLRVDVPATAHKSGSSYTRFIGADAVYSITPMTEADARRLVGELVTPPLDPWLLPRLEAPAGHESREDEPE